MDEAPAEFPAIFRAEVDGEKLKLGKPPAGAGPFLLSAFCFLLFFEGKRSQPGFQDKLASIGVHSRFLQFRPDGGGGEDRRAET